MGIELLNTRISKIFLWYMQNVIVIVYCSFKCLAVFFISLIVLISIIHGLGSIFKKLVKIYHKIKNN